MRDEKDLLNSYTGPKMGHESKLAQALLGKELAGGWRIASPVVQDAGATGGKNSVCYFVENATGDRAFLKVLDIGAALRCHDALHVLSEMTSRFAYETDLCRVCSDGRLRRVAAAREQGQLMTDAGIPIPYLLFDVAAGDVRKGLDELKYFDIAWVLRTLHQLATGIMQLHKVEVAHQDAKPSNSLLYRDQGAKIADLGSAAARARPAPHEADTVAGDLSYAPPELLYGHVPPDWAERRFGTDAYLFGSLVVFMFTKTSMTALLSHEMDGSHHWRQWRGPYVEVLPYLVDAFGRAVRAFGNEVWEEFRPDLTTIVKELCYPDPKLRGHPLNRARPGNQYSLERYVSRLDSLARRAELGLY